MYTCMQKTLKYIEVTSQAGTREPVGINTIPTFNGSTIIENINRIIKIIIKNGVTCSLV